MGKLLMSPRETHLANLLEHRWGQQLRKAGFDFPGHTGEGALSLGCGAARQLYLSLLLGPAHPTQEPPPPPDLS